MTALAFQLMIPAKKMVERLFNFNPINDIDSERIITESIRDGCTFDERSSPINRATCKLPTINENLEGFQFSSSCDRSLPLYLGTRIRRNSHPGTHQENKTSITYSMFSNKRREQRSTAGGKIKCLRDPMLSFETTPKEKTLVFHKHKLDKIDEDDSLTEVREEGGEKCEDTSNGHTQDIPTVLPVRTIARRCSYPTDPNTGNARNFVDLNKCSEKEIVTRWMKFF